MMMSDSSGRLRGLSSDAKVDRSSVAPARFVQHHSVGIASFPERKDRQSLPFGTD